MLQSHPKAERLDHPRLFLLVAQTIGLLSFYAACFCAVRFIANETDKHRYAGVVVVCLAVMLIGFLNAWRIELRHARWRRQMTEAPTRRIDKTSKS